jgi:hypothetical protein
MGAVLLQHGKVTAAARLFRNAITSDPFMSVAFLNLGNGESVTTLLQYHICQRMDPDGIKCRQTLGHWKRNHL